jgi:hypothetical protein
MEVFTPDQYIASVDSMKRRELLILHRFIKKALPELETGIVHGMLGYGLYRYKYESGREGETAAVALASNATGFSVYVSCTNEKGWLVEQAKAKLGKVNVGKSCIRFRSLADLELDALGDVLALVRKARPIGFDDATSKKKKQKKATPKKPTLKKASVKKAGSKKPARKAKKTSGSRGSGRPRGPR